MCMLKGAFERLPPTQSMSAHGTVSAQFQKQQASGFVPMLTSRCLPACLSACLFNCS